MAEVNQASLPGRMFALEPATNLGKRTLVAHQNLCVGPPGNVFLFGGLELGAALVALEDAICRPVLWAAAQYFGPVRPLAILSLDVSTPLQGRNVTQARVVGRVEDREIFAVAAALGAREEQPTRQWISPPETPLPEACEPPSQWPLSQAPGTLTERFVMRVPPGPLGEHRADGNLSGTARRAFWLRAADDVPMDAGLLAVFADFVPYALGSALGGGLGGTSLDNTLRIVQIVPTTWVLCDAQIHATHAGFAHGDIRLFAEGGELMAIGSQTINVWSPGRNVA